LHSPAVKVVINPLKTYLWQATIMQWFLLQSAPREYRLNENPIGRHNNFMMGAFFGMKSNHSPVLKVVMLLVCSQGMSSPQPF
jgi:hypothetical protein